MIIEVYYDGIHTASVDVPPTYSTVENALEYAFRWTQNIHDSWSKPGGKDYNLNVTIHAPLRDGRGHRSSMVGDLFIVGPRSFIVDTFGFKEVDNAG